MIEGSVTEPEIVPIIFHPLNTGIESDATEAPVNEMFVGEGIFTQYALPDRKVSLILYPVIGEYVKAVMGLNGKTIEATGLTTLRGSENIFHPAMNGYWTDVPSSGVNDHTLDHSLDPKAFAALTRQ